jgi:hypothetical protein
MGIFIFITPSKTSFDCRPSFEPKRKSGHSMKLIAHIHLLVILRIYDDSSPRPYTPVVLSAEIACRVVVGLFI